MILFPQPSLNQGAALLFKINTKTLCQRLMHEIITIFPIKVIYRMDPNQ